MTAPLRAAATPLSPPPPAPLRYAVVDLAALDLQRRTITRYVPPYADSLLSRDLPGRVRRVGPWLVRMGRIPRLTRIVEGLPPDLPWGYYVHSHLEFHSTRMVLRKLGRSGIGSAGVFRYWDPRVIEATLGAADLPLKHRLFEWIERIEAPDGRFDLRRTPPPQ